MTTTRSPRLLVAAIGAAICMTIGLAASTVVAPGASGPDNFQAEHVADIIVVTWGGESFAFGAKHVTTIKWTPAAAITFTDALLTQ